MTDWRYNMRSVAEDLQAGSLWLLKWGGISLAVVVGLAITIGGGLLFNGWFQEHKEAWRWAVAGMFGGYALWLLTEIRRLLTVIVDKLAILGQRLPAEKRPRVMGWIVALLVMILVTLVGIALLISWQIGFIGAAIQTHLARLRLEVGAGLGVNVDHPDGYLDGGHLRSLEDDIRRIRKTATQKLEERPDYL